MTEPPNLQITNIDDPCPVCAQQDSGPECDSALCSSTGRVIEKIEALTLKTDEVRTALHQYKYEDAPGWDMAFARLLLRYLNNTWNPADIDLVIANPGHTPDRTHTTRILAAAATIDTDGRWPFDSTADPAICKRRPTAQSRGQSRPNKQQAAIAHAAALNCVHPDRIRNARIAVFDDVCTTGYQLNELARWLLANKARSVVGLVLARQPWAKVIQLDQPQRKPRTIFPGIY